MTSNEHRLFVAVTSLNKIGEGRIRDLTGDVLFPVTYKCAMLIVIRKDLRPLLAQKVTLFRVLMITKQIRAIWY